MPARKQIPKTSTDIFEKCGNKKTPHSKRKKRNKKTTKTPPHVQTAKRELPKQKGCLRTQGQLSPTRIVYTVATQRILNKGLATSNPRRSIKNHASIKAVLRCPLTHSYRQDAKKPTMFKIYNHRMYIIFHALYYRLYVVNE